MTAKHANFETVNYLEKPPSPEELKRLLKKAGLKPQNVIRTNEPTYREHVGDRNLSDEHLIRLMAKHPELIQRPIVVRGDKAVLARPAEKLAELGID